METLEGTYSYEEILELIDQKFGAQATDWDHDEFVIKDENGDFVDENGDEVSFSDDWNDTRFYLVEVVEQCELKPDQMEKSFTGMTGPGELPKGLKNEKNATEKSTEEISRTQNLEKNNDSDPKNTITKTEKNSTGKTEKDLNSTEKKETNTKGIISPEIGTKLTVKDGNTTQKIEKKSLSKSTPVKREGIPQEDLSHYLIPVKEENLSSIQLLNNSANLLINAAKTTMGPSKLDPETGEVIQRATSNQLNDAIRCLEAVNGIMKTKLEFQKFAKSIISEK